MIVDANKKDNTIIIKYAIKAALAKFALFGFVPPPNAQTKSIIKLTNGMAKRIIVMNQSPIEITG